MIKMDCSLTDEKWASRAIHEAQKSPLAMKHGCIAVSSGKLLAFGHNTYKTYSRDGYVRNVCSCHAEINVLRQFLKRKINKVTLYIVRVSNDGQMKDSSPCANCFYLMRQFPIKHIVYTTNNGLYKCKLNDYVSNFISSGNNAIIERRASDINLYLNTHIYLNKKQKTKYNS